jgi:hypothetical protein
MAKFLDGSGVQSALTDIIKNTEKKLVIISPYLKIPTQTKNYLKSIDKKNVPITVIYRSDFTINDEDLIFFRELNHLKLAHCDNLHSKCYINEKDGLITSMNLHEHSQTHNWEMGIRFSKQADAEIYSDVIKELGHLVTQAKPYSPIKKVAEPAQKYQTNSRNNAPQKTVHKPTQPPNIGLVTKIIDAIAGDAAYCIRCHKPMAMYNIEKPYCAKCYAIWARYGNVKYQEKYCHVCGRSDTKNPISFEKPLCKDCFNEYYKT